MFLQEHQRRVLGNLSEPRSLANLTRTMLADAHGPLDRKDPFDTNLALVKETVADLVKSGDVIDLGQHSSAKAALHAVASDDAALDLAKPKADALGSRLESGRDGRLDSGALYIMSKAGFDRLTI